MIKAGKAELYQSGVPVGDVEIYTFDTNWVGIFEYSNLSQVRWTMLHELGHALGLLNHSTNPSHIMYYNCNSNNRELTTLTDAEIYNLQLLYGGII